MKNSKSLLLWFVTFMLIGCTGQQTSSNQITTGLTATPVIQTPTALPTLSFSPAPTSLSLPTESLLATPKVAPESPFILDRIRMVIVKNGNLYLQDGINPPVQLTSSGKDRGPILSDDGMKIVFYRGETFDSVYSINIDGSQEQEIIESQSLPVLGRGDIKALTFVPNTHFLLFNTFVCNPSEALYNAPDCTVGIYSVDVDSSEVSELVSGLSGNGTQTRNFEISPDGNYISVATSGHLDIYTLYTPQRIGISQQNAILYNITTPDEFLPLQYWLPDSSGLIAILPESEHNEPGTPPRNFSVWRHILRNQITNSVTTEIQLDPPIFYISFCNFSVSPDGNQIFYVTDGIPSLYLGNLNDGRTQPYEGENGCPIIAHNYSYLQWSPDSLHFAWQNTIIAIDGDFTSIAGDFSGWLDDHHYFYVTIEDNERKTYIGEIGGDNIALPESFQLSPAYVLLDK